MINISDFPASQDARTLGENSEAAAEAEYAVISSLLLRGFPFLRFPDVQEAQFALYARRQARRHLRFSALAIGLFYLLLGLCSYLLFKGRALHSYLPAYLIEGAAVLFVVFMTTKRRFERFYFLYTACAAWGALVGMTLVGIAITDPAVRQYASYSVLCLTIVVYGIALLPLRVAMACGWLALIAVIEIAKWLHLPIEWAQFSQYFVAANVLGMLVCYLLEHRERSLFLMARLLNLEKAELDRVTTRLGKQSQEDPLTGLANRRYFNEVYQREWDRGQRSRQPLSLIFIDVDHFKKYNDHYGHIEGDTCLSAVASVLGAQVKRAGDLAVRYGGEEFVLLLPNTPLDGALRVASKVLHSIDTLKLPHAASPTANHVTISVGVASTRPASELRALDLLESADAALYRAKESGRHRIASQVLEPPRSRGAEVAGEDRRA